MPIPASPSLSFDGCRIGQGRGDNLIGMGFSKPIDKELSASYISVLMVCKNSGFSVFLEFSRSSKERWPSGLRRTPGERVGATSPSRVRIPPCPFDGEGPRLPEIPRRSVAAPQRCARAHGVTVCSRTGYRLGTVARQVHAGQHVRQHTRRQWELRIRGR